MYVCLCAYGYDDYVVIAKAWKKSLLMISLCIRMCVIVCVWVCERMRVFFYVCICVSDYVCDDSSVTFRV